MSYKPIDDRQVINRAALPNIGSPAGDSLDDILLRINNILSSITGGSFYVAHKLSLTAGTSSVVVTIPAQPDTSYIVLGIMVNTIDPNPQYQQVEVTAKSNSGFTFTWNDPLDTGNYFVSYIIPPKVFPVAEVAVNLGASSITSPLAIPQSGAGYGLITAFQNLTDPNPQFQTIMVGNNSNTAADLVWNDPTDTANYVATYMINATGQMAIPNGVNTVTVPLPVNYGAPDYAIIASMQNLVDPHPQFPPMVVTAQNNGSATFSWNSGTDTANYLLNYYAISLTS